MRSHSTLTKAFAGIEDKNALAWAVLEHKSEDAVRRAIALSANRLARRRVCAVEVKRVDLVVHEPVGGLRMYEFKAAYLSDYDPKRMRRGDRWLGSNLNWDLAAAAGKLESAQEACRTCFSLTGSVRARSSAVWLLYEVGEPNQIIKYPRQRNVVSIAEAEEFLCGQVRGGLDEHVSIECGEAWGRSTATRVAIHMFIFSQTRKPALARGRAHAQLAGARSPTTASRK